MANTAEDVFEFIGENFDLDQLKSNPSFVVKGDQSNIVPEYNQIAFLTYAGNNLEVIKSSYNNNQFSYGISSPAIRPLSASTSNTDNTTSSISEKFSSSKLLNQSLSNSLVAGNFTLPIERGKYTITSRYGWRYDPFKGTKKFHGGIDLGAPNGRPIYAVAPGRVIVSEYNNPGGAGNWIILQHKGCQTVYMHCTKLLVSKSQTVEQKQQIATVGSTGRSKGPHLHFEIKVSGKKVNPQNYLKF